MVAVPIKKHRPPASGGRMTFIGPLTLAYILGVIVAVSSKICFRLSLELLSASLLFSLTGALLNWKRNYILILISFFLTGVVLTNIAQDKIKTNPLAVWENKTVILNGVIASEPEKRGSLTFFYFKVYNINPTPESWCGVNNSVHFKITPLVKVQIKTNKKPNLVYGDLIKINGKMSPAELPRFKGQFNYKQYLARHGIKGIVWIDNLSKITKTGENSANLFLKIIFSLKRKFIYISKQTLPYPESTLLSGIVLGEYSICPENLKKAFIASGTLHILAASGLNVAVLILFCLGTGRLTKINERFNAGIAIILVIIYTFIAGADPSIVRASIMGIMALLAIILNQRKDILHFLFLSALIILIYKPFWLFDIGFQLSYLSVLGIFYLTPIFDSKLSKLPKYIRTPAAVSVSAQIAISPILAYHFNQLSLIAVVANLIIVPLGEILLPLGLLKVVLGAIYLPLSYSLAPVTYFLTFLISKIILWLDKFPLDMIHSPKPAIWFLIVYYSFIGFWIYQLQTKFQKKFTQYIVTIISLLICIFWLFYKIICPCPLSVTFLDVKKRDVVFIKLPINQCVLIDSGFTYRTSKGDKVLISFLKQQGVNTLDLVIVAYPHIKYTENLINDLQDFKIKQIISSPQYNDSAVYRRLRQLIKEKKIPYTEISAGHHIKFSPDLTLDILFPAEKFYPSKSFDYNNNSLIGKLRYKEVSFLFTSDVEETAENFLLNSGYNLKSSVLKITHKMNYTAFCQFIKQVNPQYIVVTASKNNFLDQSIKKTLQKLKTTKIFITSKNGTTTFITDGENLKAYPLYNRDSSDHFLDKS